MNSILYANYFIGWFGFDRIFTGSVYSGVLKLFALIFCFPLGILWNFMDYISLILFDHFAGGDVRFQLLNVHKIIVSVLYMITILLLLFAQRRIIRYSWRPNQRRKLREKYRKQFKLKYSEINEESEVVQSG